MRPRYRRAQAGGRREGAFPIRVAGSRSSAVSRQGRATPRMRRGLPRATMSPCERVRKRSTASRAASSFASSGSASLCTRSRDVEARDLRATRPVGVEAFGAAVELERDAVRDPPAILELCERDVVAGGDTEQRHAVGVDVARAGCRARCASVAASSSDSAASASAASQRDADGRRRGATASRQMSRAANPACAPSPRARPTPCDKACRTARAAAASEPLCAIARISGQDPRVDVARPPPRPRSSHAGIGFRCLISASSMHIWRRTRWPALGMLWFGAPRLRRTLIVQKLAYFSHGHRA